MPACSAACSSSLKAFAVIAMIGISARSGLSKARILFNNQFTPDEVYDNYPADRLMHDIALALMATQTQTTEVLDTFPTIPAVQEAEQILAEAENPEVTIPQEA